VSRAEKLVESVAASLAQAAGWHGWLWRLRLAEARAEMAVARGAWEEAVHWADQAIAQSRAKGRVKYEAIGLRTRAQALYRLSRTAAALADFSAAVALARSIGDPALFLRTATALLAVDGDEALAVEAARTAARIASALPDGPMRQRFEAAEQVQGLARWAATAF
jgi:tetratricopeptide (TPR) repeat protein